MSVDRFNTDPFPLDQRAAAWDGALRPVGLASQPDSAPIDGRRLSHTPTGLVLINTGPQFLRRTGKELAQLGLLLEGRAVLAGGETVRERDLLYWPAGTGPLLAPAGRVRLLLLGLPRLDPRWGGLAEAETEPEGPPIRPGPQPVLCALLSAMAEAMEQGEAALPALGVALAEIMPASLGPLMGGKTLRAAALRRRILRAIEQRLDDPLLNLERFAASEGVSVRAVQKMLDGEGRSFSQHLRQRRLEHAAEALGDPAQAAIPVAETIAFRWGFADPTHFSRIFRSQYGAAPNAFRAAVLAKGQPRPQQGPRSRGYPELGFPREAPLPRPRTPAGRGASRHPGAPPFTRHAGDGALGVFQPRLAAGAHTPVGRHGDRGNSDPACLRRPRPHDPGRPGCRGGVPLDARA